MNGEHNGRHDRDGIQRLGGADYLLCGDIYCLGDQDKLSSEVDDNEHMNAEDFFEQYIRRKFGLSSKQFAGRIGQKHLDELENAFMAGLDAGREIESAGRCDHLWKAHSPSPDAPAYARCVKCGETMR